MNKKGFLLIEIILSLTLILISIPTLANFIIKFQNHSHRINNTTYAVLDQNYLTAFIKTELQKSESLNTPDNKSCVISYRYNGSDYTILYELINKKIRRKQIKIDSTGKTSTTYTYLNNKPEIESIKFYIYTHYILFILKTHNSTASYQIYLGNRL